MRIKSITANVAETDAGKTIIDKYKALYKEFCNGTLISELEFDIFSTEWNILQKANEQVISLAELKKDCNVDEKSLIPIIDELSAERLIFHNRDYSEIVSVVDILTSI